MKRSPSVQNLSQTENILLRFLIFVFVSGFNKPKILTWYNLENKALNENCIY